MCHDAGRNTQTRGDIVKATYQAKVEEAINMGSPGKMVLRMSFPYTFLTSRFTTELRVPVSQNEWPADQWPPNRGDTLPITFDFERLNGYEPEPLVSQPVPMALSPVTFSRAPDLPAPARPELDSLIPPAAPNEALEEMTAERDRLQAFKDYVHEWLDKAGVPEDPNGPHSAEGCRVGDRLDWLMATLTTPAPSTNSESSDGVQADTAAQL